MPREHIQPYQCMVARWFLLRRRDVCVCQPGLVDDGRSSGSRRQRPRGGDNSTGHCDSPYFFVAPQRHWRAMHCNESLTSSNRGQLWPQSHFTRLSSLFISMPHYGRCRVDDTLPELLITTRLSAGWVDPSLDISINSPQTDGMWASTRRPSMIHWDENTTLC